MIKKHIFIAFIVPIFIFGQNIPQTPKEIVSYAITQLTNGNIEALLAITENAELRKTKELVDSINNKTLTKDSIKNNYQDIKAWSIDAVEEHKVGERTVTIVSTTWTIKRSTILQPNEVARTNNNADIILQVDYMLEKFNNQWKIISRRTKQ